MKEVLYSIHWLNITVHGSKEDSIILYDRLFRDKFGDLQSLGHGGRGFKDIQRGLAEFKLYSEPLLNNGEYFHLEIPGLACEALNWNNFKALYDYVDGNFPEKYKFTRLDLAFDQVNFTPDQAEKEIIKNNIRSLAKRDTLEIFHSPLKPKDNGEIGTKTVQFGSRSSQRMIRIYDKRGFTRLEFEVKQERSDLIAKDLLKEHDDSKWFEIAVGHLRDFIDFKTDWWIDLIQGKARANQTLTEPSQVSLEKMTRWIGKQVTPVLSVLTDVLPYGDLNQMIAIGRKRRGDKYDLIIENAGRFPGRVPTMRKGSQEGPSISQEDQT